MKAFVSLASYIILGIVTAGMTVLLGYLSFHAWYYLAGGGPVGKVVGMVGTLLLAGVVHGTIARLNGR
jgi:hypothetical protein